MFFDSICIFYLTLSGVMSKQVKSNSKSTVSKTQHGGLAGTRLSAATDRGIPKSKSEPVEVPPGAKVSTKKAGRPAIKSKGSSKTYADAVKKGLSESVTFSLLSDAVPIVPASDAIVDELPLMGEVEEKTSVPEFISGDTEEELANDVVAGRQ